MRLWEYGVFTKTGWGIHLLIHNVNDGAGLGGLFMLELPKISFSVKILVLDVILTIGNIREELDAAIKRRDQSQLPH